MRVENPLPPFQLYRNNTFPLSGKLKVMTRLYNLILKIAEKGLKIGQFGQFYPILPTFYEFKSRFEKSW
jgi:hypothetical protein